MTEHPTHTPRPTRKEVEEAISSIDFPLQKEALVRCVQDRQPNKSVLRQVEALPLATYESAADVLRSVELADQHGR